MDRHSSRKQIVYISKYPRGNRDVFGDMCHEFDRTLSGIFLSDRNSRYGRKNRYSNVVFHTGVFQCNKTQRLHFRRWCSHGCFSV
ncbi:hypothetical protein NY2A_b227L [Paramecium bursaria Chlorella virus NY2A]|uniref:Uncharacterized protein b227L n=1 Tax=Paramecium bursaria Chlorella virus NY2A TaxID=46021 RepID=A7IWA2_PBCVN|nr:hypothetical protein NY2A_b227L [Paramecium bursaria Chlorella virus NY2A]ABT14626.1 hypothetical protein NY2A_b227L [Paramecium bursaria Chlorella virus NY2A]